MYRTDLVRQVARQTGLSQRRVAAVLRASEGCIQQALSDGQTVTLAGFGSYYTREQLEGTIRSARTGRAVRVPAHRVAAFRVGAVLRRAVLRQRRRHRWL